MKKFLLLALILVSAVLAAKTINCEGSYSGHLQGIDSDGKYIYWSFTKAIVKTDMEGKIVLKIDSPNHSGDPCLLNGKLYVPVNKGAFNKPKGKSKDFIYVYNAETLELIKEVATPQYEHGAGGMAAWKGHIWLTGGLPDGAPGNIILEFTEDLEFVKRHDSPGFTSAGIQTIKRMCGYWWYGVYDKPANVLCDDNFVIIARPKGPSVAVGMAELKDGTILVGRTKSTPVEDNPKKKVWTGSVVTATFDAETKAIVVKKD